MFLLLLALCISHQLQAAGLAQLNLLANTNFAVLAETTITTTGGGSINGNIGLSPAPGSAMLVTCAQVTGTIYSVDATGPLPCRVVDATLLTQAVSDMMTSYNDAAGRTPVPTGPNLNPGSAFSTGYDMGGLTLAPGLYKFGSGQTAFLNTDVTLSGGPSDVWIFQCGADLEVANGVHVILAGGANANNIFWQVTTKAVLGTTADFNGTILAGTSITMNTGSTMNGRALAQTQVTFNGTGALLPVTAPVIAVQQPAGTNLVNNVVTNYFGLVAVGTNISHTFIITNNGSAELTLSGITIDGTNATSYAVTNLTGTLRPGGSTNFTVNFTPTNAGVQLATLHVASNDPTNGLFNIVVIGRGMAATAPIIGVQQPVGTNLVNGGTNNFGSLAVGTNASHIFTITNFGTANLTGLFITIDGSNSVLFTVTTNPVAPLPPGNNTTFTVRFAPLSAGVKTAVLHIANNDPTNNPFNIALTGAGTGASLVAGIVVQQPAGTNLANNISTNDFGSISSVTNTSHTFTIMNIGSTNLTGLGITIDGTDAAMFRVTTNAVAPLNPGSNTTFTVLFAPFGAGARTAALHIANNDPNNNPFTIALAGTGTNPAVTSATNLQVMATSPVTQNPQTGLFEQTVRVTNSSPGTAAGVRLYILTLATDVQVYNASGNTNGTPYLLYNFPLAAGATVDFVIEYYRANGQMFPSPVFVVEEIAPVSLTFTNGVGITIDHITLTKGGILIGFYATPGRAYAIQYSSNMLTWLTANPFIIAPANYVQWIDAGPPKTQNMPACRYYRAFELP